MPRWLTTYLHVLLGFVLYAIVIGFAAPALISQADSTLAFAGLVLLIALPPVLLALYTHWRGTGEGKRVARAVKKLVPVLLLAIGLGACSKVPAGNVGVIVNLYGSDKGVSEKEVGVGRYWVGWNEELYLFPTFTQTDTWAKTASKDESVVFQTGKDGMVMSADFGITFHVDPNKVTTLFQTYRKGIEEISDIYLRNMVRDAVNERAAALNADEAYGRKKNELVDGVETDVRAAVASKGIVVEKVYLIGDIRLPTQVKNALDMKNTAFQKTLQREQEVAQAKAEADIKIEEARGVAESITINAKAQAEANRAVAASLTPELVQYRGVDRWDGKLPQYMGSGAVPFIDITRKPALGAAATTIYGVGGNAMTVLTPTSVPTAGQ